MPGHDPMLHVTGRCTFPRPGFVVELRRHGSMGLGQNGVTIVGPQSALRSDGPPVFAVDSGPHPFLAVEVATDARLFDRLNHANERRRDNWFASWERGPL